MVKTLELSPEQQKMLDEVLGGGQFETPAAFLDHALTMALIESESFIAKAREMLAEAEEDVKEGRVVAIPQGGLAAFMKARRQNASHS